MSLTREQKEKLTELAKSFQPGFNTIKDPPGHRCLTIKDANGELQTYAFEDKAFARGSIGQVFLARDIHSGSSFVIKSQPLTSEAITERAGLEALKQLVGCYYPEAKLEQLYEAKKGAEIMDFIRQQQTESKDNEVKQFWLVMKKVPGKELKSIKENATQPNDAMTLDILYKSAHALKAMNEVKLLHCDINPTNILYDADSKTAGLIDVSTRVIGPSKTADARGSPAFVDPAIKAEMHDKGKPVVFDESTEVFALGSTLAYVAGLTVPQALNDTRTLRLIEDKQTPHGKMLASDSPVKSQLLTLFRSMRDEDPKKRPTLAQVTEKLATLTYPALPSHERAPLEALVIVERLHDLHQICREEDAKKLPNANPAMFSMSPLGELFTIIRNMTNEINQIMGSLLQTNLDEKGFENRLNIIKEKYHNKEKNDSQLTKIFLNLQQNSKLRTPLKELMEAIRTPNKPLRAQPELMELALQAKTKEKIQAYLDTQKAPQQESSDYKKSGPQ